MASSGKVRLTHIIGTLATVLLLATTGAIFAGDGQSADGRFPFAIEAHEVLPPGAIAASPTIKTTTASTLLTDGFEGSFPGSIWQLYHDSSSPDGEMGKEPLHGECGILQHLLCGKWKRLQPCFRHGRPREHEHLGHRRAVRPFRRHVG